MWAFMLRKWAKMREIHINTVDGTPRKIVAVAKRYPSEHYIEPHEHRRPGSS